MSVTYWLRVCPFCSCSLRILLCNDTCICAHKFFVSSMTASPSWLASKVYRYVLPLAITNTTKIHFQNSTPIKTKKAAHSLYCERLLGQTGQIEDSEAFESIQYPDASMLFIFGLHYIVLSKSELLRRYSLAFLFIKWKIPHFCAVFFMCI